MEAGRAQAVSPGPVGGAEAAEGVGVAPEGAADLAGDGGQAAHDVPLGAVAGPRDLGQGTNMSRTR